MKKRLITDDMTKEEIAEKAKSILKENGFFPDPKFLIIKRPKMVKLAKELINNPEKYDEIKVEIWKCIGCY